jgi:8-demethyl-8-alpha-L-rhamnosyltetracenomycin-C 2'-O-methyltransferase
MWDRYFPRAELHFVDNLPAAFADHSGGLSSRCHFHVSDQGNTEDLRGLVQKTGGEFDVVIDDGGHRMDQQLVSFKTLFPHVKSGGLYIIEDLHTSYWPNWGGSESIADQKASHDSTLTIRFLQSLVDDVNFVAATTCVADRAACPDALKATLTPYQQHIKSLHFHSGLCVVVKM